MINGCILKQSESENKELLEDAINKIMDPNFFNDLVKDDPTRESLHERLEEYLTAVLMKLAETLQPENLTEKEWCDRISPIMIAYREQIKGYKL